MADETGALKFSGYITNTIWIVGLILGIIILVAGWTFFNRFFNDLIVNPIHEGSISGVGLIIIIIFLVWIFGKTRRYTPEEIYYSNQRRG